MMIISEGTPMTNGEVYALLRRRRDERNAKLQPPFGLQFVGSSNTPQMQQQRANTNTNNNNNNGGLMNSSLFFPPEALMMTENANINSGSTTGLVPTTASTSSSSAASTLLSLKKSALFALPTASHLVVLLTEVRALRYLSRNATISGEYGIHAIYGPTSVNNCRRSNRHIDTLTSETTTTTTTTIDTSKESGNIQQTNNNNNNSEVMNGNREASPDNEEDRFSPMMKEEELLQELVQRYRPGTIGHVRAVDALLLLWETRGREMERRCSNNIKSLLRVLRQRLGASNNNNEEEEKEKEQQQRHVSSDPPRLAFDKPSLPLALFLSDNSHSSSSSTSAAVTTGAMVGISSQEYHKWTEEELIRIIMARPQDSLDVYRILDDLDEICGSDEELKTFFEEEIVKVFK